MLVDTASFLLPVATQVAFASCKATLAIALLLLCRKLFAERLSAQVRHGLWLVVLAALLLPWGFSVPIQFRHAPPAVESRFAGSVDAVAGLASGVSAPASRSSAAAVQPIGMPARSWMVLLWAAVVIVLAMIPVWHLLRCRRIASRAGSVSGPALDLLLQCRQQLGLRRRVRLLESDSIASPVLFGWLAPVLLLPPGLQKRFDSTQLRHVFLHELAHVQRHDILVNWVATGAQILHWFNPVVWYGLRVMRSDMEQACDARVLGHLAPREHADYGRTLIGVLEAFPRPAPAQGLGVVESHAQLKERIVMIAKFSTRPAGLPVAAVLLSLCLASVAATQPRIRTEQRANTVQAVPEVVRPPAIVKRTVESQAPKPAPSPVRRTAAAVEPARDAQTHNGGTTGPILVQDLKKLRVAGRVLAVLWTRREDRYTLQVVFPPQQSKFIADTIARLRAMDPTLGDSTSGDGTRKLEPAEQTAPTGNPGVQVWLLRADGTTILPTGKSTPERSPQGGIVANEVLYSFPRFNHDVEHAVAAAIRVDEGLYIEPLQPF